MRKVVCPHWALSMIELNIAVHLIVRRQNAPFFEVHNPMLW
jgi:hypothetical protein